MQLVPVTPAQLVVVLGTMEQFLAPCSPLCPPLCPPPCSPFFAKAMPTMARRTTADFSLKAQTYFRAKIQSLARNDI